MVTPEKRFALITHMLQEYIPPLHRSPCFTHTSSEPNPTTSILGSPPPGEGIYFLEKEIGGGGAGT